MSCISFIIECRFEKGFINRLIMPMFTDEITNVEFGFEMLQVDVSCGDDIPNKMERQDVMPFM